MHHQNMAAKIYYDDDADLSFSRTRPSPFLATAREGHAQAEPERQRIDRDRRSAKARPTMTLPFLMDSISFRLKKQPKGALVSILLPDEVQGDLYREFIKPNLSPGNLLMCSHGFNIHFDQVVPPEESTRPRRPKGPGLSS
ncbi:MAG: hypothetical protein R3B91_15760 [Planctomycetaceae bacterium]